MSSVAITEKLAKQGLRSNFLEDLELVKTIPREGGVYYRDMSEAADDERVVGQLTEEEENFLLLRYIYGEKGNNVGDKHLSKIYEFRYFQAHYAIFDSLMSRLDNPFAENVEIRCGGIVVIKEKFFI